MRPSCSCRASSSTAAAQSSCRYGSALVARYRNVRRPNGVDPQRGQRSSRLQLLEGIPGPGAEVAVGGLPLGDRCREVERFQGERMRRERVLVQMRIHLRSRLLRHRRDLRHPTELPAEALDVVAVLDVDRLLRDERAELAAALERAPTDREQAALDVEELAVRVLLGELLVAEPLEPRLRRRTGPPSANAGELIGCPASATSRCARSCVEVGTLPARAQRKALLAAHVDHLLAAAAARAMFIAGPQWMFRSSVTSAAFARPAIASSSAARYGSSLALSTIVTLSGVVASVKIRRRISAVVVAASAPSSRLWVTRTTSSGGRSQTSSSASTVLSMPHASLARRCASTINRRRGAGASSSTCPIRSARLEWSPGTATNPVRPSSTTSGIAETSVVTTGTPAAIASPITVGSPSMSPSSSTMHGSAKTSASASAAATASWLSRSAHEADVPGSDLVGQGPK